MIVFPSRSVELDRAGRRWVKFEKCRWNLEYALSASTENISGGTHTRACSCSSSRGANPRLACPKRRQLQFASRAQVAEQPQY